MIKFAHLALALGVLAIPALAVAQSDEKHPGPHPEAIAACKDKADGDTCEYESPRGHLAGTCRKAETGDLACWHPHKHRGG